MCVYECVIQSSSRARWYTGTPCLHAGLFYVGAITRFMWNQCPLKWVECFFPAPIRCETRFLVSLHARRENEGEKESEKELVRERLWPVPVAREQSCLAVTGYRHLFCSVVNWSNLAATRALVTNVANEIRLVAVRFGGMVLIFFICDFIQFTAIALWGPIYWKKKIK